MLILPVLMIAGCAKKNMPVTLPDAVEVEPVQQVVKPIESRPLAMVLKATAFKMTGDYSNNVAITLTPEGEVSYYPAPSDISESSRPVDLGNGWWLNRQGISPSSVFTKYTFEEYSKLPYVPTPQELKAAVIPGASVSDWHQFSIPASQAMQNLPQIKSELGIK